MRRILPFTFFFFFYHLLLKEHQTKPNQTQSPFWLQSASSAPQRVGPHRAETQLTPPFQLSRPVLGPKSCCVTSENPSDPKDNSPKMLPSFSS